MAKNNDKNNEHFSQLHHQLFYFILFCMAVFLGHFRYWSHQTNKLNTSRIMEKLMLYTFLSHEQYNIMLLKGCFNNTV